MGRLQNKVAIITGAGSGIGKTAAQLFVAEGAKLAVVDLHEEQGRTVAQEIGRKGDAIFVHADTGREADLKRMADETVAAFGRIDIFWRNAGIAAAGALELTICSSIGAMSDCG